MIMRPEDRTIARRSLDKRLNLWRNIGETARPPHGWVKAIREALGMTGTQLADRLGVSQPRVFTIEKAEVSGSITLDSLERAARALDCRLVYALVPRNPLQDLVKDRAELKAEKRLESTRHSMALEAQGVNPDDENEQLKRLIQQLSDKAGSKLWEEDA